MGFLKKNNEKKYWVGFKTQERAELIKQFSDEIDINDLILLTNLMKNKTLKKIALNELRKHI